MDTDRPAALTAELRAEMARRGLSLGWLAQGTGYSVASLSRRLNGHTPMSVSDLDQCLTALGMSFGDLVRRAESHAEVA